jgi:hypothetical protein
MTSLNSRPLARLTVPTLTASTGIPVWSMSGMHGMPAPCSRRSAASACQVVFYNETGFSSPDCRREGAFLLVMNLRKFAMNS